MLRVLRVVGVIGIIGVLGIIGIIGIIGVLGELRGIDPGHGDVEVEDAAEFHFGGTLHLIAIEPVAGETHDLLVHAVLQLQQGDRFGVVLHDALHQRFAEAGLEGCKAFDGRRQLTMVAGKDNP